ncbi:ribosome small subunit-dependent GTPase A [Membranihabitans marinus]|uniref:ribosome small subunit-dependent GTPase A n=1 Tax=Membranihabitans marinus TaxID=1227546 RepID=UPI001F017BC2|nr:ribosome small subunit-dependent GTPase A [Membranihabitans marinus]
MKEGVVIKSTGSWYTVSVNEELYQCRIKGKFRLDGQKLTNPVAVGDKVMIEIENVEEESGVIVSILERKNYILRQSPRKKHFMHLMAANIDQAILIVTIKNPELKPGFIDRFLLVTEPHNIPVVIVFNKSDLYSAEDLEVLEVLEEVYQQIGYQTMAVSAKTGNGMDQLKEALLNKTSVISGQSGVGKSSILNYLAPELTLREGDLSDYSGKGQHTTTFAEMYSPDFKENTHAGSTKFIDTPGIKTLGFNNLEVQDVAHNFREFFVYSQQCRFSNCVHRQEPGCAVKEAIENGYISVIRYDNYLAILDEIEDQNYWERHTHY